MIKSFANDDRTLKATEIIEQLSSSDAYKRHQARLALESLGESGLEALKAHIEDRNWHVRWEVVKALGEMGEVQTASILALALRDEETSVRWAAMDSLIQLGRESIRPMLELLTTEFSSVRVREGVHHVLHALNNQHLLNGPEIEVFHALEGAAPGIQAAWAASRALS